MKRASRKPEPQTKPVTLDQMELYTSLHLRLVELEHLAPAVEELL